MKKNNLTIQIPEKIEAPILIKQGIVLTEVKINGKKRNFIIDSGAPNMILNATYQSKKNLQKDEKESSGVGGNMRLSRILLKEFSWKGLNIKNAKVGAIDLSHLEKQLNIPFYGLIGYRELSYFSFTINYREKKIILWRDFNKNQYVVKGEIPFVMHNHIPIIKANVDGIELKLGLDTGAAANLFDSNKIKNKSKNKKKSTLLGADKAQQSVEIATIDSTLINDISFNKMRVIWSNIDHLKSAFGELDGLLGYEFLKKKKMAISYSDKKIYLINERRNKKAS